MGLKGGRRRGSRGSITRRSLILAAVTSGSVGVAGAHASGAFDNVVSDRGFDIRVESADAGLLGIDIYTVEFSGNSTETLLTLTNNFSEQLSNIEVETVEGGSVVQDLEFDDESSIAPGESEPIVADLACDSDVDHVSLEIDVSTDSEAISVTRDVPIECESGDSEPVETDELDLDDDTIDSSVEIHGSGGGSNIDVSMDESSIYGHLDVDIQSGGNVITVDIDDSTIDGDLTVSPGGGGTDVDINIDDSTIEGDLTVDTDSGGIDIDIDVDESEIHGDLRVDTDSGGIDIDVNIDDDSTIEGELDYEGA